MGKVKESEIKDLTGAELENRLSGELQYLAIRSSDVTQYNRQSCDCSSVALVYRDYILLVQRTENGEDEPPVRIAEIVDFDISEYGCHILPPPEGTIDFIKVAYFQDGTVEAIKFRYGERYLYIFSGFELIVTKSIPDLMEEDDAPLPEVDDSFLFDNLH